MPSPTSGDVLKLIGRNIRAERARRELTQEALAEAAGIGAAQLARMERGESDTGISKYVSVARALRVSPTILLQGVD